MPTLILAAAILMAHPGLALDQEFRPIPEDSLRIFVPGCAKDLVFTAGPVTEDQPGRAGVPEGMHFRMAGPQELLNGIRARQGSMIEVTGLVLKRRFEEGLGSTSRFRFSPGNTIPLGGSRPGPVDNQVVIDVEDFRVIDGQCPR